MPTIRGREDNAKSASVDGLIVYENAVAELVVDKLLTLMDSKTLKKTAISSVSPSDPNEEWVIDVVEAQLQDKPALHLFSTFGLGGEEQTDGALVDEEAYNYRAEIWTLCADMSDRGVKLAQQMLSTVAFIAKEEQRGIIPGCMLKFNMLGHFAGVLLTDAPLGNQSEARFAPSIDAENKLFIMHLYATALTQNELENFAEYRDRSADPEETAKNEKLWQDAFVEFLTELGDKAYSSRRAEFKLTD